MCAPTARARSRRLSTSPSGSRGRPSSPTSSFRHAPTSSGGTSGSGPPPPGSGLRASTTPTTGWSSSNKKCIEPLGRSKSDYEIFSLLAGRLGLGEHLHGGWSYRVRMGQAPLRGERLPGSSPGRSSSSKGYHLIPAPAHRKRTPALRWFAEDRQRDTPDTGPRPWETVGLKGLETASGKIEFVASSLQRLEATGTRRSGAPGDGSPVHPQLGGTPHRGTSRQVSTADGQSPPALLVPHHGRRQGLLDRRGQGPPRAHRRPPLLDPPPQPRGRCLSRRRDG